MSDIKISDMQPWVGAVTGDVQFPAVFGNENYRIALSQVSYDTFGFGSMALQDADAVNITGGNVAVTALSGAITIANGGTGLAVPPGAGQLLIGTGIDYTLASLTAGANITITNGAGSIEIAATNSGTVTSVGLDGGATGLTVSGTNPITSSGTFTLGGTLSVANGGTGATTASGARTSLGAAKSGVNSDITQITGLTTPLDVAQGGTGANDSLSGYIYGNGLNPFTSVLTIPASDIDGVLAVVNGGTGADNPADARVNLLPDYTGNGGKVLAVTAGADDVEWIAITGTGTVTSVNVSGGTTGLTTSGGPIVAAGTITIDGTLIASHGGTGYTSYTNGQLLIGKTDGTLAKATLTAGSDISVTNADGSITIANTAPDLTVTLTGGTGISVSGVYPTFTLTNTAPDQVVSLTAGTGMTVTGTYPNFTLTNAAPDQVVSITGGGTTSVTGTYPNFTVSSSDQYTGTVTSVDVSGGTTGLTTSGGPITGSGTITLSGTLAVANGGTGQNSYTDGQILIGNSTGNTLTKTTLSAGTGISVVNGAGSITVTNSAPDQVVSLTGAGTTSVSGTYPSFTITSNDQYVGTVTSVDVSGGTTGLTFSGGPITGSGTITMAGKLAVANGGTNATATPSAGAVAYGTGTAYAFTSAGTAGQVLLSNGTSAPSFGGINGGTF